MPSSPPSPVLPPAVAPRQAPESPAHRDVRDESRRRGPARRGAGEFVGDELEGRQHREYHDGGQAADPRQRTREIEPSQVRGPRSDRGCRQRSQSAEGRPDQERKHVENIQNRPRFAKSTGDRRPSGCPGSLADDTAARCSTRARWRTRRPRRTPVGRSPSGFCVSLVCIALDGLRRDACHADRGPRPGRARDL